MNVALFIFNRPDLTRQVFEQIALAKPERLLIISDGPRPGRSDDVQNIAACHRIVETITWPCQVDHNYAKQNLGCGHRIASGLNWVFSLVEGAIILEDDCLPSLSFFPFCQHLLQEYRHDTRVMHIAGTNLLPRLFHSSDVIVSRLVPIWGWATWRRAWSSFDYNMAGLPLYLQEDDIKYFGENADFVRSVFEHAVTGKADNWDAQWAFACVRAKGLSLIPRKNLVRNIGFSADATHTTKAPEFLLPHLGEMPVRLRLPSDLTPVCAYDREYLFRLRGEPTRVLRLIQKIKTQVRALIRKITILN